MRLVKVAVEVADLYKMTKKDTINKGFSKSKEEFYNLQCNH